MPPEDQQLAWCLGLFWVTCFGSLALVALKYRSLFHPLLIPVSQLWVMAGLAPVAQGIGSSLKYPPGWWMEASLLSSLYVAGLTIPILCRWNPRGPVISSLLRPLEFERRSPWSGAYQLCVLGISALAGVTFLLLMRDSVAGNLWVSDPRTAYMVGRTGVGHWYVASQTFVMLALLVWLYFVRPTRSHELGLGLLIALAAMYFYGSKAGMVSLLVFVGVYYNYYVRTITNTQALLAVLCGLPLVLISPWLQGNFDRLSATLEYYDYFDNAALYVGRAERFGPQFGSAFLSSFWEYVPRGFYPAKPFVYGNIVFNDHYYPGAAQEGYTPGWLPWVLFHLDLGGVGVLVGAWLSGWGLKAIHTEFLKTRSFPAWVTWLQFAWLPVLRNAPFLYYCAMLVCLCWGLRLAVQGQVLLSRSVASPNTTGSLV